MKTFLIFTDKQNEPGVGMRCKYFILFLSLPFFLLLFFLNNSHLITTFTRAVPLKQTSNKLRSFYFSFHCVGPRVFSTHNKCQRIQILSIQKTPLSKLLFFFVVKWKFSKEKKTILLRLYIYKMEWRKFLPTLYKVVMEFFGSYTYTHFSYTLSALKGKKRNFPLGHNFLFEYRDKIKGLWGSSIPPTIWN